MRKKLQDPFGKRVLVGRTSSTEIVARRDGTRKEAGRFRLLRDDP
jgi:hypothetical protein